MQQSTFLKKGCNTWEIISMPRLRSALTLSEVEVSTVLLGKQKPTQTPWESPVSGFLMETLRI